MAPKGPSQSAPSRAFGLDQGDGSAIPLF